MSDLQPYTVGLVIYPGMTTLDIVGPQTVFSALSGIKLHRIWKALEPIEADDGMVVVPDTTFADCPSLDVLCIGGGLKQMMIVDDPEVLEFLKKQGNTAQFITSVCGGSMFLAKAGLLQGYRAATHWAMREELAKLGVEVGTERVIVDGNRISGGGVTAGIDFGLTVAKVLRGEEAAKMVQLAIEYNPAPPFDVGSPEKAGSELVEKTLAFVTGQLGGAV
ncbi:glutamine amidotransferase [Leptolyngbya sp. Heron Island J]|uniref:DJ-1/PfpI family protein n=1 Tax=Leptolyngbya sp. Heron Island J TaxID=1385935 RepID=UPI0003B9CE62|nr:DJ-1/PfpI family protein [Leptolyngbya sp. Heron Island J]ESA35293.1 glutamine amidotransferase [Leptolyngbya sp. Heron Island J]